MKQKLVGLFSAVAIAAMSFWFFSGALAAPEAIDLSLKFSTSTVSIDNPELNANIVVERTEESGTPPFTVQFLLPQGMAVNGDESDILIEGVDDAKPSIDSDIITISGTDLGSGRLRMQVPLKFGGCPENANSCTLTGMLRVTDSDGKEASTSADIEGSNFKAIIADDLVVNVKPVEGESNEYRVQMIYERSEGTSTDNVILGYRGIPWKNISDPKIELKDAEGFTPEETKDGDGMQATGQIAEGGQVILGFNIGMPPCANGAEACTYTHQAYGSDANGNVVVWENEFNYTTPKDEIGELDLGILMIGEQLNRTVELKFSRDGGEGTLDGEIIMIIPETPIPLMPTNYKVQAVNGEVGEGKIDGRSIIWPVSTGADGTANFLLPVEIDPTKCEDPECKDFLLAQFKSTQTETIETKVEFTYSDKPDPPAGEEFKASLEIGTSQEINHPGDPIELNFLLEELSKKRAPGTYGFLLEVSGLIPTGKTQAEFTDAGPEKIIFSEKINGLKWEGEIGSGGQIDVKTLYKADSCSNGGSCSAGARLTILLPDGTEMVLKETILIEDDSGFDPDLVNFKAAVFSNGADRPEKIEDFDSLPFEAACMTQCDNILLGIKNNNEEKAEVWIVVEAASNIKLGPPDGYKLQLLSEDTETELTTYRMRVLAGDSLQVLGLTAQIDGVVEDDSQIPLSIDFCAQQVGSQTCLQEDENRAPDNLFLLYLIWRMRDFGDAPSSDNHFGVIMNAYGPGTAMARYPLARDPSILPAPPFQIKGPAHRLSNLFHLGAGVSPEFAIDRNWDADGSNNIEPSIGPDEHNLDLFDDGVDLTAISLPDQCNIDVEIPVEVTITPQIITFFTNNDADGLAHINIWLDSDRDGRWGNGPGLCFPASNDHEHIVIDHTFDPVALGVGTHSVIVTSPLINWPQAFGLPDEPAWMRVMLTAIESNKDAYSGAAIPYGDGRGEDFVYFAGETEDYYFVASDAVANADNGYDADMAIDVDLVRPGTHAPAEAQNFPGIKQVDGEMVIRFRNEGYKMAEDVEITADLPQSLIDFGSFSRLKCDGCDKELNLEEGLGTFKIDRLNPGEFGEIVLGWTGCLTCVRGVEGAQAIATISVKSKADFRLSNNNHFYEAWPVKSRLAPQVSLGWHGCLTCVRSIEDDTIPSAYNFIFETNDPDVTHFRMYVDGNQVGDDMEMCDGIPCKDLGFVIGDGIQMGSWTFTYVNKNGKESPPSKPIDLSCTNDIVRGSLVFENEATGKQRRIPAEAHQTDILLNESYKYLLEPGASYKAAIMYCGEDENPTLSIQLGGETYNFSTPVDEIYQVVVQVPSKAKRAPSSMIVSVESDGTTYEDTFTVEEPTSGMVSDALTGEGVSGAQMLILAEQATTFGGETTTVMAPWDGSATGQSNPVTTTGDGGYSLTIPNGKYQLVVVADGYQTYRTSVLEVTDGQIASSINLIEARPAPSNIDIGIGESGFEQSFIEVEAGWVVKFINTGSGMHGAASDELGESSGLMAPGESFKMAFETAGTFTVIDPANSNSTLTVQVTGSTSEPGGDGTTIFLPILVR